LEKIIPTLDSLFDVESCISITKAIWENDRWCSRDKNELTAQYCAEVLRDADLSQVELLPLTADGKTKYFDWTIPKAWDTYSATLHYANGEKICEFLADTIRTQTGTMIADSSHPREKRLMEEAAALALHSLNRICENVTYPAVEFSTEPAPEYAKAAGNKIPQRIMAGPLTFKGTYNGKTFNAAWSGDMNIPVFWIDGKRNLWQIAYLSAVEKGKCTDEQIKEELEMLTDYFACLAENGYIRWL